jgi:peptide/nickel transport system permease protein
MAAPDIAGTLELPLPARRRRRSLGLVFWFAVVWIGLVFLAALAADILPLADPAKMSLLQRRQPPSVAHLFGTDHLGRDMLARTVYGSRVSLSVGLISAFLGLLAGGILGLLAGYFRGRFENLTMASMDVLLAFPPLVLALAIIAYLGQSVVNLTLTLALLSVPTATRVARATTLAIAEREFVLAARALGASHLRIMLRELLPNVILPLTVFTLIAVAVLIVAEGALSFLGLGVPPPTPSWGSMMAEGREQLDVAPHIAFIPAIVMFLTVLSFNLVGDTLRTLTDPRRGAP